MGAANRARADSALPSVTVPERDLPAGAGEALAAPRCRVCGGAVRAFFDFGRQSVSNAFITPDELRGEAYFRLAVGLCTSCTMVQQLEETPRHRMFHAGYPYRTSTSARMRAHFESTARHLLRSELGGADPFLVEIGCNDGVLLSQISAAGVRHLGVDPSAAAAEQARIGGAVVTVDFFEESSATAIRAVHGPADVIYSANTVSHVAYVDSVFRGVDALLAPRGVFVFEDRYLGDIIERNSFDQIYDEHFYLFTVRSVQAMVARFGFELVDVELLPVHGGAARYTVARPGARAPTSAAADLLARERRQRLAERVTFTRFATRVARIRDDLTNLLRDLRAAGATVAGYGATSRSATVTSYCGIGPELISYVCDSTPEKQGRLTPGSHIPVRPPEVFADPYPDYALLFAWNHAEEILAKERRFSEQGGRWILYVPGVHVI